MRYKSTTMSLAIASSLFFTPVLSFAQEQFTLEEIVVTARKTNESLVDTPVAVSVMTEEFFVKSGFNTMSDVVKFVPGFDYSPTSSVRANGTRIRGIRTASYSEGFESSVAVVIDGVVMARESAGFFDLYDIESVEVIKGPQGTLFGKNASAGVVNITTKRPSEVFEGNVEATLMQDNEYRLKTSISGPLNENVNGSLTVLKSKFDGFLKNEFNNQ